ncbi:STM3941 family protein [Streptococcus acidominimus]|uniref:Membrane protein n=1 Tax=Streptococcus acidominimus TaxID=1326 RepID=A0A1Q8EBQ3_STRAI|nr:STM3941 family protein [Streptococcus acidominimus]OLF49224.1 hypothetical protein BU200_08475 [Streptococcus acidominimus]SUN05820.1 membrane protein [Streptococcus acidominimus]
MSQPIIVTSKKRHYALFGATSLLMVLLSIFCIFLYSTERQTHILSPLFIFIGILGILFFSGTFVFYTKRLLTSSSNLPPILLVDEKGIVDKSSALAIGFIPWEDISCIHLRSHINQTYISVTLKDNETYLAKMNAFQKYCSKVNLKMGFPLVNIVLTTSNQTPEEVYYAILHQYGENFTY